MGVMMARELEEPEKGLNPEPEIALGEDGMSDEVNLGESDSSYREVENLVKELQGADIPLTLNEDFLLEEEGFEMLPEVVVEENAIGGAVAVFGAPLRENPLLRFGSEGTSVLGGEQLRMKLGGTLGETLASQPGVYASS